MVKMKGRTVRRIVVNVAVLAALLGIPGCGHVQTLSTPGVVTVQEFGCGGDIPSPHAPYCMQADE
jgi:hypothetical protein